MPDKRKIKIALVDSHALIHRAYHALPYMSTADGQPTNAVYGFTTMLLKMLTTLKPTHVAAAFDMKGPTFRHKEFADYKAQRKPADADLVAQFDVAREVARAFNIPIVEKQGFEADDIIGTLARQLDGKVEKIIVTGDADAFQLVDDDTRVFTLKRGMTDTLLYDEAMVREKYGFAPKFLADYKGLQGDASDNIPGVEGIGDKTARQLVGQYGSIEEIYKHLDELSERARNSLTGHKDEALKYRRLATIDCKVPIKFNLDEAEMDDYDAEEVRRVFERLEFRTLLTRLPKSKHPAQPTLFKNVAEEKDASEVKLPDNYHLVQSEAEQKELMARLRREKVIGFDTENDRLGAREYPIVGMSFAAGTGPNMEAWYVPVTRESVRKWRGVLENKEVGKVGHNLKYDVEVLRRAGVGLDGIVFDSMLASYLLRPGIRQHGLDLVAGQELGHHAIPITDLIGEGKQQKTMSEVPLPELARYAAEDAELALRLYEKLSGSIKKEGLTRVLNELELPLILVLADMELTGVKLDSTLLKKMSKKVGARLDTLRQKIWQEAGEEFNVNSTQQLREILFNKLNLSTEGIKKTQTGFSTAAAELDKLHGQHPIIELIEEQRELSKLQNTYLETLPELADKETGRVYTSFNQTVAATGRLSSSDPNLQNIPARTPLGQEIRAAFTAGAGKVLVKADYSQVELRLAAHMSGDEKMLDTFRAGEDIHTATAAWVHGVKLSEVTAKQRRAAKTLNFGVLYGMGPQKFARSSGLSMEEARSFIERYKEQYKGVTALIARTVEQAESLGYVETLFGRRRYIPEINSRTPVVRAAAERAAFNFPLQGTAADILKKAMVELFAHLQKNYPATKMVLTVHDELVCETPADGADKVAADMKRIMEGVFTLDIPLVVDVGMGRNWRDMR